MPCLATILITLLLILPAISVELFRYRGACQGRRHAGVRLDAGEQNSPNAITKEKAAEVAADFMTTFITNRSAGWRHKNFGQPRSWIVLFSDTVVALMRQMFFVVVPPNETVVEPRVEKRL